MSIDTGGSGMSSDVESLESLVEAARKQGAAMIQQIEDQWGQIERLEQQLARVVERLTELCDEALARVPAERQRVVGYVKQSARYYADGVVDGMEEALHQVQDTLAAVLAEVSR